METEKSCKIGFAITGSFCTHEKIKEIIQDMVDDGMDIIPIFSENVQTIDSRFGRLLCGDLSPIRYGRKNT